MNEVMRPANDRRDVATREAGPVEPGQRAARALLVLVLGGLGLYVLHRFLPALIWAAILTIAIWPLYARAERRLPPGKHNILLPALFTAAVALAFLLPLVLVALQAAREAHDLVGWLHQVEQSGLPAPAWLGSLPMGSSIEAWWQANLAQPGGSSGMLHRFDRSALLDYSRVFGSQIVNRIVIFGFTLLTLFFLFRDGRTVVEQGLVASYRLFGPRGERVARQMVASVHGTVDGLVLVGLGEGFLLGIVYFFCGVPHPVLFGALTAVAAMIPFGAPAVFVIAALLAAANGSVASAAIIVAGGLVVTFVADHFVRPVLIGGTTKLPFVWVLLGILGGVENFGLLGLFLGPAVMAALILLWREFTTGAEALAG